MPRNVHSKQKAFSLFRHFHNVTLMTLVEWYAYRENSSRSNISYSAKNRDLQYFIYATYTCMKYTAPINKHKRTPKSRSQTK